MTKRDENALKKLSISQCCALEVKAANNTQGCFNKTAASAQGSDYLRPGSASAGSRTRSHTHGWRQAQLQHRLGRHWRPQAELKWGPWCHEQRAGVDVMLREHLAAFQCSQSPGTAWGSYAERTRLVQLGEEETLIGPVETFWYFQGGSQEDRASSLWDVVVSWGTTMGSWNDVPDRCHFLLWEQSDVGTSCPEGLCNICSHRFSRPEWIKSYWDLIVGPV